MSNNRLNSLISFLEESPSDPFIKYCIALEYEKMGDKNAQLFFDDLLDQHPDYLATYYAAGKYFESLNEIDKAESLYTKGIALAKATGNLKAAGELETALNLL